MGKVVPWVARTPWRPGFVRHMDDKDFIDAVSPRGAPRPIVVLQQSTS